MKIVDAFSNDIDHFLPRIQGFERILKHHLDLTAKVFARRM
ncbi:Uncharacterised protein [Mycobacteroides abscessus subsp. abscessus]|nr:Uncharacterised protein [Mycobacteroides abscessus subsp. abscessus]